MERALAAVVLCGGRSRRMGRDKALIEWHGEPLVTRVARRIAVVADPVMLAPATIGRLGPLGLPEVADAIAGAGPLGGLIAGLEASPHALTAVVATDLPYASGPVLRLLAELHAGEDAVVPLAGGLPQPLHAVYARTAIAKLRRYVDHGGRAVLEAVRRLDVRAVGRDQWAGADPSGRFADNFNTPADLGRIGR